MAAAVSGIWNHAAAAQSPMTTGAKPMAAAQNDDSNDNSDSGGATISSNDFLTLLVTEMQNQDPTADTDPNELHQPVGECEQPGAAHPDQPDAELSGRRRERGCCAKWCGRRSSGNLAGRVGINRASANQPGQFVEPVEPNKLVRRGRSDKQFHHEGSQRIGVDRQRAGSSNLRQPKRSQGKPSGAARLAGARRAAHYPLSSICGL